MIPQAIQPGASSSSQSGAVRGQAAGPEDAADAPAEVRLLPGAARLVALEQVDEEGDQQQQDAALHARQHGADGDDGVQEVADVARLQWRWESGDVDDVVHAPSFPKLSRGHLAGREFLQARPAFAALQLVEHVSGARPCASSAMRGVKPEVGDLGDDARPVAVLAGHDDLGRLLADLLQHRVGPLGDEARDIALAGSPARPPRRRRQAASACRRGSGPSVMRPYL